jgi:hypothetical protein
MTQTPTASIITCAFALLAVTSCDSPPAKPSGAVGAAAPTAVDAGKPRDPFTAKLVAGKWAGTLGEQAPVELSFTEERDGLAARLVFRRFGRSLVSEHLKVTLEPPATVRLKGTRATALVGKSPTPLHEVTATLAADGASLAGQSLVAGSPKGVAFAASTAKSIDAVDPPLDAARAEAALVEGKWEGKAGDEPIKLVVTKKGAQLLGKFTHAGATTTVEVKPQPNGVVTVTSAPARTGQKLVTNTFEVAFTRADLGEVSGNLKVITQLGTMMQGQTSALSLQDRRPRKKAP